MKKVNNLYSPQHKKYLKKTLTKINKNVIIENVDSKRKAYGKVRLLEK